MATLREEPFPAFQRQFAVLFLPLRKDLFLGHVHSVTKPGFERRPLA